MFQKSGLVQYIKHRHRGKVPHPVAIHQLQAEPPRRLPARVIIDVSHHHPQTLAAPAGWEIIQRNGRVWMIEHNNRFTRIDSAQYNMLLAICDIQKAASNLTTQFLVNISTSYPVERKKWLKESVMCTGAGILEPRSDGELAVSFS